MIRKVIHIVKWALLVVLVLAVALAFGFEKYKYAYIERKKELEIKTSLTKTNTDSIYTNKQLKRALKKYDFIKQYDVDQVIKDSYVIPGLKATRTLKKNKKIRMCTSMVPQGVCVADRYVLISAYCSKKKHNSVIYVIDKKSHRFIKEVVLKNRPHVGGITYDPVHKNIWICGYKKKKKRAVIHLMSLKSLARYDLSKMKKPVKYLKSFPLYSLHRASFIDYNRGKIYIGTFKKSKSVTSMIQSFTLKSNGLPRVLDDYEDEDMIRLLGGFFDFTDQLGQVTARFLGSSSKKANSEYLQWFIIHRVIDQLSPSTMVPQGLSIISGKIQGCAVSDRYTYLSSSHGPRESQLYIFKNDHGMAKIMKAGRNAIAHYSLPPMMEQIADNGGKLYLCFESASYIYRARWNDKVDRILALDRSKRKASAR